MIRREERGEVLLVTMDNPPAQAISPEVVAAWARLLDELEGDPPRALVLTGSGQRFFSAGLDILEVFALKRADLRDFMDRFVDTLLRFHRFPAPVVAAVNGHAVAGGAVLALTADRRLMVEPDGEPAGGAALFGLNEVQVGLPLPGPLFEVVRGAVGRQYLAQVLLEGKNYSAAAAQRIGLVDELVAAARLAERAVEVAAKMASVPRRAFSRMKELLQADTRERLERAVDNDPFVEICFEPESRRAIDAAREKLLARKSETKKAGPGGKAR